VDADMARTPRATLAILGAATLLAGCGEPAPVTDRDGTLHLELGEYTIRPQNLKTRAGRIRIVARNTGRLAHDVVVEELVEGEGAQPRVYGRTAVAAPGATVREREPIYLRPGRYRILCDIANHDNLGQYGTLEVTR
jgi:uncharacterized cupredoxin-like copper-binding protein